MSMKKGPSGNVNSRATWTAERANLVADLTALRAAIIGLAAKLDDDGTVTDTNYEATWTPAALKTTT